MQERPQRLNCKTTFLLDSLDVSTLYAKVMEYSLANSSFGWAIWTKIDFKNCGKEDCLFGERLNWLKDTTGWKQCTKGTKLFGSYIYQSYQDAAEDASEFLEDHYLSWLGSLN